MQNLKLDSQQWQTLKDLFHRAIEVPIEERAKFIDLHSGGEPWLKAELESLIEAHEKEGPFMEADWLSQK